MKKKCIFVYEISDNLIERKYDELYDFLLNKGFNLVGRCSGRKAMIDSVFIRIVIGYSSEDLYGYMFDETFEVPDYRDDIKSRLKYKDGPPFAGTVYDYIDCLISHVSNTGKGLPPGYFEDMNTILKGGEMCEDSGI